MPYCFQSTFKKKEQIKQTVISNCKIYWYTGYKLSDCCRVSSNFQTISGRCEKILISHKNNLPLYDYSANIHLLNIND